MFPLQVHFYRGNNVRTECREIVMDQTATAKDCITELIAKGIFATEIEEDTEFLKKIGAKTWDL